jgi:hypothetical protein
MTEVVLLRVMSRVITGPASEMETISRMRNCSVMGSICGYLARSGRPFQAPDLSAILCENLVDRFLDTTGWSTTSWSPTVPSFWTAFSAAFPVAVMASSADNDAPNRKF